MAKATIEVEVTVTTGMSLWTAIKLRIAGARVVEEYIRQAIKEARPTNIGLDGDVPDTLPEDW